MKRKIMSFLLAGTVMFSLPATANAAQYEGPGFDSPQEAVTAYLGSFDANNVEGMIAACAVESYVENYDMAYQVARVRSWTPSMPLNIPNTNEYASQILTMERVTEISKWITNQYLTYSMMAVGKEFDYTVIQLETSENDVESIIPDAEEMLSENFGEPLWLSEDIDELRVLTPEEFFAPEEMDGEKYFSEMNQRNIQRINKVTGAEECQELICSFSMGDYAGLMFMNTGKYNGRWYVLTTQSNLSMMAGLSVNLGGLIMVEKTAVPDILDDLFY